MTEAAPDRTGPAPAPDPVEVLRRVVAERAGGESRPQQEQMVDAVDAAIRDGSHLLVQAGTGTGKSLGYLIPAVLAAVRDGKKVVVSTGTKALSDQLGGIDLPLLEGLLPKVAGIGKPRFAVLKGKASYVCLNKVSEMLDLEGKAGGGPAESAEPVAAPAEQDGLWDAPAAAPAAKPAKKTAADVPLLSASPDLSAGRRPTANDLAALRKALEWVGPPDDPKNVSGDRSDLPAAVPDSIWQQLSVNAVECKKKKCFFYEQCYSEKAREQAQQAHVVVTNHALVAMDLQANGQILGGWDRPWTTWIADEGHEVEAYLSSAWGSDLSPTGLRNVSTEAANRLRHNDSDQNVAKALVEDAVALADLLEGTEGGRLEKLPSQLKGLMEQILVRLDETRRALDRAKNAATDQQAADEYELTSDRIKGQAQTVAVLLQDNDDYVRWYEEGKEGRAGVLKVAPLWIGPELMQSLGEHRTLIATSATLTVGGSFEPMAKSFGFDLPVLTEEGEEVQREHRSVDVGSPFDYARQAMVYVPLPDAFPAPDFKTRDQHAAAVQDHLARIVRAAGGRTLALFTTTFAAKKAAEQLRLAVPQVKVLAQGDMPAGPLAKEFVADETSVLCATMGFWAGIDPVGATCVAVVIDKVPFAPMNDPLTAARRQAAENAGRDGFHEIFVAGAATHLAQGAGRLIRSASDKGVIAVLDPRLRTKSYGRALLRSLPGGFPTGSLEAVEQALERLTGGIPADAPRAVQPAPPRTEAWKSRGGKQAGKRRR